MNGIKNDEQLNATKGTNMDWSRGYTLFLTFASFLINFFTT